MLHANRCCAGRGPHSDATTHKVFHKQFPVLKEKSKRSGIWGSVSCGHEQSCLLIYIVVLCVESKPTFRGTAVLANCFMLVSYLAYFSTLEMKVDFQQTTRRYISENRTFQCKKQFISKLRRNYIGYVYFCTFSASIIYSSIVFGSLHVLKEWFYCFIFKFKSSARVGDTVPILVVSTRQMAMKNSVYSVCVFIFILGSINDDSIVWKING
jgi:hypothetical protein